jgi:hypothetical protein
LHRVSEQVLVQVLVRVLALVSALVLELVWAWVSAQASVRVWAQVSEPKILGSRILEWQNSRRVPTDNPS